jgi:hypothetical protein
MSAERFYVFTPGKPGYISAEVAVRVLPVGDPHEPRAWANDSWPHHWLPYRIISRSEALMVPLYREALEAWERRDDSVLQATEVAEILESTRGDAELEAVAGCRVAQAALVADDDERIREAVCRHAHEGCGWRFPDEPKQRPLRAVPRPTGLRTTPAAGRPTLGTTINAR